MSVQKNLKTVISVLSLICFGGITAQAQLFSNIKIPDLTFQVTDKDRKNFHKQFFFHKNNVNLDKAYVDLLECFHYSSGPNGGGNMFNPDVPKFVPLGPKVQITGEGYRHLGAIVDETIHGTQRLKFGKISLRKCMEFKNYDRYGLSKAEWRQLNDRDLHERIPLLALLASGSAPVAEKILP